MALSATQSTQIEKSGGHLNGSGRVTVPNALVSAVVLDALVLRMVCALSS